MDAEPIRLGVVGVGGRGRDFARLLASLPPGTARMTSICDTNPEALALAARSLPDAEPFTALGDLLEAGAVDAMLVATPMPQHARMSVDCLRRGVHVLCEVPAAVTVEEARELAQVAGESDAVFAMAENYIYTAENRMVRELVRAGCFGELYYGRGEYLHELKALNETTPWRRIWQTGVRGVTYPTHSLGPLLDWFAGDRIVKVACSGSGSHHTDPRGEPYHDDSATMVCRLASGGELTVRVDMVSDRPHAMTNYELQGTDGVYESGRGAPDDHPRVWLRALDAEPRWRRLEEAYRLLRDRPAHARLAEVAPPPEDVGHGGGDYFALLDFLEAIRDRRPPCTDVHRALDLTLPGLTSRDALLAERWVAVPDSRSWVRDEPPTQLQMIWPEGRRAAAPRLPAGYELGLLRRAEREAYVELMQHAGFGDWTMDRFGWVDEAVLPDGHFVVRRSSDGKLVATALAAHRPVAAHPAGGELGWVAADPAESGKGLGRAVCAAVVNRFASAGYRRVYLLTDDYRTAALAVYLKLGFVPFVESDEAVGRWRAVFARLAWPEPVEIVHAAGQAPGAGGG